MALRRFRKVADHKWLGGVCAGLGYATGIPAWVVRVAFVVTFLFYGLGILPYVLLWIFAPKWPAGQPADYEQVAAG